MVEGGSKRLYVGNLFPEVTSDQLKERFERYGAVESAEVKHKTDIDGKPIQTFAFVNIVASAASISQCINAISKSKWKGYDVKVQQAKESFMSRLQKERQNKENWSQKPAPKPSDSYDPIAMFKTNLPDDDGENEGDNKKNIKPPVQTKVPRGIAKKSANYEKLGSGDVGKEDNGVIDFSGAANKKNQPKGLKRKLQAYHSSDEEEGGDDAPVKKNKKPVMGEGYDPLALIKGKKSGDSPSKRKKFDEDGKEEKEQAKESMEEERKRNLDIINEVGKTEKGKINEQEHFKSRNESYDREKPKKKPENKSSTAFMPRFDPTADTPEEFNAKIDGQGGIKQKYETSSNLRDIFGKSSVTPGSGFSFGFGGQQKDTDNNHQTSKPKASKDAQLFQVEKDEQNGEDEFKNRNLKELAKRWSKKDSSDKFGTLLFAKAEVKPFFITTDDERLKEAADLFYNDGVDLEYIQSGFTEQRRHNLLQISRRRVNRFKLHNKGRPGQNRGRFNRNRH